VRPVRLVLTARVARINNNDRFCFRKKILFIDHYYHSHATRNTAIKHNHCQLVTAKSNLNGSQTQRVHR